MKNNIIAMLVLTASFSVPAKACRQGDTSKTLLIVAESPEGEENKVIAEISASGEVEIQRRYYLVAEKNAQQVVIKSFDGSLYSFDLANAKRFGSYCYPVIFAE